MVAAIDFMKGMRAHGDYTVVPEAFLAEKPDSISFDEATSLIVGPLTAFEALVKLSSIESGQRVLINGASGGVGVAAVQIANHFGCEIVTTSSEPHFEKLNSLGAKTTLNYRKNFFTDQKYDVIFDVAGRLKFMNVKDHLKGNGAFITSQPLNDPLGFLCALFSKKSWKFLLVSHSGKGRAETWKRLISEKIVSPVIDSSFDISRYSDALDHYRKDSVFGKIVLKVNDE